MIPWLDRNTPFPDPETALSEPDGLLAAGGDLSPERLLNAYHRGIFPWFEEGQPILWWSPDPRMVLFPERLKVSRSLRKTLRRGSFRITFDHAFATVMDHCAAPRGGARGTWITPAMRSAYVHLHHLGFAHSVECWREEELVGGLYGVALGRVFFGESMFSRASDASKCALVALAGQLKGWGFRLIDCQMHTAHLASLGAEDIPRHHFTTLLEIHAVEPGRIGDWRDVPPFPGPPP